MTERERMVELKKMILEVASQKEKIEKLAGVSIPQGILAASYGVALIVVKCGNPHMRLL